MWLVSFTTSVSSLGRTFGDRFRHNIHLRFYRTGRTGQLDVRMHTPQKKSLAILKKE